MNDQNKTKEELIIELAKIKNSYALLKASQEKDNKDQIYVDSTLSSIKLAIHNSREVIFLTDKQGLITFVNPEFTNMYGFTEEEVVGKKTPRILNCGLYPKEHAAGFWAILLNKKGIPASQYVNKRKNGELVDVEGSADPILDENDEIIGFLGIQRDITLRKEAEKKLKENESMLRELNATKDKIFSIIAHDLKGPLSTIIGFTELLKNNVEDYDLDTLKRFIELMDESGRSTFKLLENLLDWAFVQRGTITYNPEKTNLLEIVHDTIAVLGNSANSKSIEITNTISSEISIKADKHMVSTVIRNLLSNAIKFTPKEGRIRIEAHGPTEKEAQKFIEIRVVDSGVGMNEEMISHLFNFSETKITSGTENEKGTGLGLILCKEFVERHGGKIWIESEVMKGSSFIFTMPLG